jgi:hypothetical protein
MEKIADPQDKERNVEGHKTTRDDQQNKRELQPHQGILRHYTVFHLFSFSGKQFTNDEGVHDRNDS